jgi:hypothetical protein
MMYLVIYCDIIDIYLSHPSVALAIIDRYVGKSIPKSY